MSEVILFTTGMFINFMVDRPELRKKLFMKIKSLLGFGKNKTDIPEETNKILVD